MRRILYWVIIYSIAGYALERLINLVVNGYWLDNSVLFGPYQPMYGLGVVLTLLAYQQIKRLSVPPALQIVLLIGVGILTTYLMEFISGHLYYQMYTLNLWDYRTTFSVCTAPYTCWLPTTLFGFLSAFTVYYVHPFIAPFINMVKERYIDGLIAIFLIDVVLTYMGVFI